jgi:hypothetical protein
MLGYNLHTFEIQERVWNLGVREWEAARFSSATGLLKVQPKP